MTKLQRIEVNGARYQTRWPMHAFRRFLNAEVGEHGQSIPSRTVTCMHCNNTGIVILDDGQSDGAACPMCVIGRMHNKSWRMTAFACERDGKPVVNALPIGDWYWRPSDDFRGVTWNHGLSIDHTEVCRCGSGVCVPHGVCSQCQESKKKIGVAS